MQLGCAADDAVLHVGNDDRAVTCALFGIAFDEAVIQEAVEAVVPASRIEPQQVIAQQRQFFLLAECPHIAEARPRTKGIFVWQVKTPLGGPRGSVES